MNIREDGQAKALALVIDCFFSVSKKNRKLILID